MNIKKMETKKDAIEDLKKFYISMYKQEKILYSKVFNDPTYINHALKDKELQQKLDELLSRFDNEDEKIETLKKLIDGIFEDVKFEDVEFEDVEFEEVREKLNTIGKGYYETLLIEVEKARGLTDEEIILDIIEQSNLKIHEDKSEEENFSYGDLSRVNNDQIRDIKHSYMHNNNKYNVYPIGIYETYKKKENADKKSKVIAEIDKQYLMKFKMELEYKLGKTASMEFFGDIDLERNLEEKDRGYFLPMLGAIAEATKEGNSYIGHIDCIYKDKKNDINTFIRRKDKNLENRVKQLIEKESKEQQRNENENSEEKPELEKT